MNLPHRIHNCEAIILHYRNFKEADRILTLFTPDLGKLDALARGVRKTRSHKVGHVEPFMYVSLVLRRSKWLPEVSEAQIRAAFPQCRSSLERITQASYVCELTDALIHPEDDAEANATFFRLLHDTLNYLNQEPAKAPILLRWFDLKMLALTGFQPELFNCVHCGTTAKPEATNFSFADGGILCSNCRQELSGTMAVPLDAFKILRHMLRHDWDRIRSAPISPAPMQTVTRLLERYIGFTLERQLKAVRFARQLHNLPIPNPESR